MGYVRTKSLPSIIAGWSVGLLCEYRPLSMKKSGKIDLNS